MTNTAITVRGATSSYIHVERAHTGRTASARNGNQSHFNMNFGDLKKALKKINEKHGPHAPDDSKLGGYNRPPAPLPTLQQQQQQPLHKAAATKLGHGGIDVFAASRGADPPARFEKRPHPLLPRGCADVKEPIQTNNFYNNLCLEDQTFPVWTLPYSLWASRDPGQGDVGLAFNHTDANQRVFGPEPNANPAQFYFNPPKIKSWVFAVDNINANEEIRLENHQKMSVKAKWNGMTFPLVHGMAFVTCIYDNRRRPVIASQVGVQDFRKVGHGKYRAQIFNQVVWSIYVLGSVELSLQDPQHIVGSNDSGCVVQICRGESKHYDDVAGAYPTSSHLSGCVDGSIGQYKFTFALEGSSRSGKTLVWCLPHHQEAVVSGEDTGLWLDSPTKGVMRAYKGTEVVMEEAELPVDILWEPWSQTAGGSSKYSDSSLQLIRSAAEAETKQDVVGMANIDSMYTSGKILDKFAHIAFVCKEILHDEGLTNAILSKLKEAVDIFATNKQKYPLVYDTSWKGLISSAEPGADFGNSNYNDHHFHYGYHIHAIAMIAKADPQYFATDAGKRAREYATTLIRDVANPDVGADGWFPQSRSFDWFHGHSFAHGIFALGDGKDEESSSEDYHFVYALKLFGNITGDSALEGRANLMLAIMRRAINMYMLFSDDNKIQPPQIVKNKVSGIYFENKIDYSTYFGRGTIDNEWIHGIHMLPITPISSYIRGPQFVKEEWEQKLGPIVDRIPDGWKGILMLNLALYDPQRAWLWFSRVDWNDAQIDNGMSRTWSLAYIAGIGGAD
jgi:endo-1,3(4)-beta-glucanase